MQLLELRLFGTSSTGYQPSSVNGAGEPRWLQTNSLFSQNDQRVDILRHTTGCQRVVQGAAAGRLALAGSSRGTT